jgi:hypothetical protein
LLGIVLKALSNAGFPFFSCSVLATRGNHALVLDAFIAIVLSFLLFAVSVAESEIHSVEYTIQEFKPLTTNEH